MRHTSWAACPAAHRVLTAVAICLDTRIETALSISEVRFATLSDADIRRYVDRRRTDGQGRRLRHPGRAASSSSISPAATPASWGYRCTKPPCCSGVSAIRSEQGRQPPGHHASTVGNGSSSRPGPQFLQDRLQIAGRELRHRQLGANRFRLQPIDQGLLFRPVVTAQVEQGTPAAADSTNIP